MDGLTYEQRVDEFKKTHSDWHTVVDQKALPISGEVSCVLRAIENGPRIVYWLGLNPEFTLSLSRMTPFWQTFEIGILSAKLEGF